MQKNPGMGSNQGKSGNNFNQPVKRDARIDSNTRSYKDKHAEEVPGKDYHHVFNMQDSSKPRNVTVNYKF